jgi:hypothetical protein
LVSLGTIQQSDPFSLKFNNRPFPISKLFQGVNKSASGTNAAILMALAWMMISDQLI